MKKWWLLLLSMAALASASCSAWPLIVAAPMPEALAALQSDAHVRVDAEPWLIFQPVGREPFVGLVFYPGNRVDPRAYAPAAHTIAAAGYLVVITPMPLGQAIRATDQAAEVVIAFPAVRHWAIGGHSMGGAAAALFAYDHPSAVEGLVLWAAGPPSSADLSGHDLVVVCIYGTRDGWVSVESINTLRPLLPPPPDTRWVSIEGGNHAQFGWYGPQRGDNEATIGREAQQQQIVAATLDLLGRLGSLRTNRPEMESVRRRDTPPVVMMPGSTQPMWPGLGQGNAPAWTMGRPLGQERVFHIIGEEEDAAQLPRPEANPLIL